METFQHSVDVDASAAQCYDIAHAFAGFPSYLRHVRAVNRVYEDRWHCEVETPGGKATAWDIAISLEQPGRLLEWHTVGGSVRIDGNVLFEELASDKTRVTLAGQYKAPEKAEGESAGRIASHRGATPQQMIAEDMDNYKRHVEKVALHGYEGPFAPAEREVTMTQEETYADPDSDDPLDSVLTPYLGEDGGLGRQDALEMRADDECDNEIDVFETAMDVDTEDMGSYIEDRDEEIQADINITEDFQTMAETDEADLDREAHPLEEGRHSPRRA